MTTTTIEDLTTITVDGTGAFDQLMQATKSHLTEEYKSGRIKGAEYSQVYLGALVAVMDQAVKFLQIQQQDKLILAQIQEIEARKALIEVQRDNAIIEGQNLVLQGQLINAQVAKTNADKDLVDAQITLIPDQKAQMQAQTQLIGQQRTNLIAEALNIPKQGQLIDAQKNQATAQGELIGQQKTNLIAEGLNIPKQGILLDKQAEKSDAEKDILVQKKKTEEAQIKDTVDGAPVTGVIGKQKDVYTEQAKGFKKKAEADIVKIMSDIWSVARTTDDSIAAPDQAVGDHGSRLNTNLINALSNATV